MARQTKRSGVRKKRRREGSRAGFVLRGIRLHEELDHRLDHAMQITGLTRSDLVREAVSKHLDRLEKRHQVTFRRKAGRRTKRS